MTSEEIVKAFMTEKEIVQSLRYCSDQDCIDCAACKYFGYGDCLERLLSAAADLIERLPAENAELLEIAKNGKDCDTCKHCEVCAQPGIDVAHWCDRCVEKCPCYGCDGGHWEWRGLPEAPEEGEKA